MRFTVGTHQRYKLLQLVHIVRVHLECQCTLRHAVIRKPLQCEDASPFEFWGATTHPNTAAATPVVLSMYRALMRAVRVQQMLLGRNAKKQQIAPTCTFSNCASRRAPNVRISTLLCRSSNPTTLLRCPPTLSVNASTCLSCKFQQSSLKTCLQVICRALTAWILAGGAPLAAQRSP